MIGQPTFVARGPDQGAPALRRMLDHYTFAVGTLAGSATHGVARIRQRKTKLVVAEDLRLATVWAVLSRRAHPCRRLLLCITGTTAWPDWLVRLSLSTANAVVAAGDEAARLVIRLANGTFLVFAMSSSERTSIRPFLQCPAGRKREEAHRLVFAHELAPPTGAAVFLMAAMAWAERNRDRRLEICCTNHGMLEGALKAQPIPPNFDQRFLGPLSEEQAAEIFAEIGILVAPAIHGHASHPVLLGLAAALPALGSFRCEAVRRWVRCGKTGWMFDPFCAGAMSDALTRALETPAGTLNKVPKVARADVEAGECPNMAERVRHALEVLLDSSRLDHASGRRSA